ncbi:hypothetical protein EAO30_28070 [Klebsiella pneumoniae]|nr:hypothetical protein EAO30_28070 [Klebsiella pneumoniae]
MLGAVRTDADVPAQLADLCERLRILVVYDAGSDARYYSLPAGIHHSVLRPVAGIYLRTNPADKYTIWCGEQLWTSFVFAAVVSLVICIVTFFIASWVLGRRETAE